MEISKSGPFAEALAELGLTLTTEQIDLLIRYAALLRKWNRSFNLVSEADLAELESRHLLDSLAISAYLQGDTVLDIGTGAGLPGIPLAIANPDRHFVLLDSNGKKTRFLFQARTDLALGNVDIENCRVEHYQSQRQIAIVTCRAFASIPDIISLSRHLIAPGTTLLAMKGRYPDEEIARLPSGFEVAATQRLKIPGNDSERHLVAVKMLA